MPTLLPLRSDHDIRSWIISTLNSSNEKDFLNLDIEVRRGIVTIRGDVSTHQNKALCLDYCQRIAGTAEINDYVNVIKLNEFQQNSV